MPVPLWWGLSAFDPLGLVVFVVALLWWWGVVFDLWIVVASILHAELLGCWPLGWWSGVLCVVMCNFFFLYSGFFVL